MLWKIVLPLQQESEVKVNTTCANKVSTPVWTCLALTLTLTHENSFSSVQERKSVGGACSVTASQDLFPKWTDLYRIWSPVWKTCTSSFVKVIFVHMHDTCNVCGYLYVCTLCLHTIVKLSQRPILKALCLLSFLITTERTQSMVDATLVQVGKNLSEAMRILEDGQRYGSQSLTSQSQSDFLIVL